MLKRIQQIRELEASHAFFEWPVIEFPLSSQDAANTTVPLVDTLLHCCAKRDSQV